MVVVNLVVVKIAVRGLGSRHYRCLTDVGKP